MAGMHSKKAVSVKNKKAGILALIALLLIIAIVTGITAYFTSIKTATNVFTIGNVRINLTEGDVWDAAVASGEAPEIAQNIQPGQHIAKAPKVENIGSNPAYVYLKVYVPLLDDEELFTYTINEPAGNTPGWTKRQEEMHTTKDGQQYNIYTYEYSEVLAPNNETTTLFDEVIFAEGMDFTPEQVTAMGNVKNIIINAYAIQSEAGVNKTNNEITELMLGDNNETDGLVGQIQVGNQKVRNNGTVKLLKGATDIQISFDGSEGATYASSETSVATVDNTGKISTVDTGTTIISISGSNIDTKQFTVQVVENVQNATIKVGNTTDVSGTASKVEIGKDTQITTTNCEDIEYEITPAVTGITVDSTEKITVAGDVAAGTTATITLTGKLSGNTRTIQIEAKAPITLHVGDTVKYNPTGTSTWEGALATSNGGSDVAMDATGNYKVATWKVLSIDGDNIKLVPSTAVGSLTLQGAQGYNNNVYLLDKVCSELYSTPSKQITATSIKIEDIENYMTGSALDTARGSNYNTQPYGEYSKSYSWYPEIYASEINSTIDGATLTSGLGLSENNGPITANANGGKVQAGTSIQPVHTYYSLSSSTFSNGVKSEYNSIKSTLSNLLFGSGNYWVASRCVNARSSYCSFNVRYVYSGSLDNYGVFSSYDDEYSSSLGLRPVVSLSSDALQECTDSGYMFEVK